MLIQAVCSLIRNPSAVSTSFHPLCSGAAHRSAHRSARRRFPAIAGAPPMRLQSTRFVAFKCQRAQAHIAYQQSLTISILYDFFTRIYNVLIAWHSKLCENERENMYFASQIFKRAYRSFFMYYIVCI